MGADHHRLDVAVPQDFLYRQEAGQIATRCVGVTLATRRGSGIFVGRDASILTARRRGGGVLGARQPQDRAGSAYGVEGADVKGGKKGAAKQTKLAPISSP